MCRHGMSERDDKIVTVVCDYGDCFLCADDPVCECECHGDIVDGIEGLRLLADADLAQACSVSWEVWQDALKELFCYYADADAAARDESTALVELAALRARVAELERAQLGRLDPKKTAEAFEKIRRERDEARGALKMQCAMADLLRDQRDEAREQLAQARAALDLNAATGRLLREQRDEALAALRDVSDRNFSHLDDGGAGEGA